MNTIPNWGYRPAAQRAADAGATLLWGARAIARGLDIPWDRQDWKGPDADDKKTRLVFCRWFLDDALAKARIQAPLLREDECVEVARLGDGDMYPFGTGRECILVARKAGGYVYLTAARLPSGANLLEAQ